MTEIDGWEITPREGVPQMTQTTRSKAFQRMDRHFGFDTEYNDDEWTQEEVDFFFETYVKQCASERERALKKYLLTRTTQ